MHMVRTWTTQLMLVGLTLSAVPALAEAWTHPDTGSYYFINPPQDSWRDAVLSCHEKGLAVFDPRFVSEEESKVLLDPRLHTHLKWEARKNANSKIERDTVTLWVGSGLDSYGGHLLRGGHTVTLLRDKTRNKIYQTKEWSSSYKTPHPVLCFEPTSFWYWCTGDIVCDDKGSAFGPFPKWRLWDFGPTESEGIRRIVERSNHPGFAGGNARCYLSQATSCDRVFP